MSPPQRPRYYTPEYHYPLPIHPLRKRAGYNDPVSRRAAMFEYLSPRSLATPQEVIEYLELQQAAQDFRLEVEHRANLEAYYQWYDQIAAENRRDLEQMRTEANLLTWFSRRSI